MALALLPPGPVAALPGAATPSRIDRAPQLPVQKPVDALAGSFAAQAVPAAASVTTGAWTVWGCDLSDGYVRINADYTT